MEQIHTEDQWEIRFTGWTVVKVFFLQERGNVTLNWDLHSSSSEPEGIADFYLTRGYNASHSNSYVSIPESVILSQDISNNGTLSMNLEQPGIYACLWKKLRPIYNNLSIDLTLDQIAYDLDKFVNFSQYGGDRFINIRQGSIRYRYLTIINSRETQSKYWFVLRFPQTYTNSLLVILLLVTNCGYFVKNLTRKVNEFKQIGEQLTKHYEKTKRLGI